VHSLWNARHKFAGRDTAAVRSGYGQLLGLQRSDGGLECVSAVVDGFVYALSVRDALSEVRERDEITPTFFRREGAHFKRVVSQLAHGSGSIDEFNELPHVDRLDGPVRWYGQGSTILSNEDAVAALLVSPIYAVLASDGLEVADLPVELGSPHGGEELGCRVHAP
jgi:hypothetical protein